MRVFEVLCAVLACVGVARSCSVPVDWESKSIEERARGVKLVVYGTVVSEQYPPPDGAGPVDQVYWVTFSPLCWLRRGPDVDFRSGDRTRRDSHPAEFANITVSEEVPCTHNDLIQGKRYILFLMRGTFSNFTILDVNTEAGAFEEPSKETFEAVHRGIDAGSKGDPDGECLDGVEIPCFTGERDPDLCNGGAAMGAARGVALGFVMSALAVAVSVY